MPRASNQVEPNLPWVESAEDKRFRRLTIIFLVLFMGLGIVLNMIELPEPEQRNLVDVSPRLAKLILEKKKEPPPKPEVEKPQVEKKEEEKPKPKPTAREIAKSSGLLAAADELADLRDSFDLDEALELPQQTSGNKAIEVTSDTALLSSQARQSSGGITTSNLTQIAESTELVKRSTTIVTSNIESAEQTKQKIVRKSDKTPKRTAEEIERVFQQNRGGIFSIYNRALRTNPTLEGKVVLELTIDPDGTVTDVTIISSELGDPDLEKKLALRVKRFKFAKANVARVTVTYPIDFLPS
jgi:TonB family protein